MKRSLILLAAVFLLTSCANSPTVSFSDIAQKNEVLKEEYPQRVKVNLDADCTDEGECTVSADNLTRIMQIITNLNDEVEKRIDASNKKVDALSHLEYQAQVLKETSALHEEATTRCKVIETVKQIALAGTCALLLGF